MKKLLLFGIMAGTFAAVPAQAGGFFSLHIPGLSISIGARPPVCAAPAPVCAPPAVVIAPPQVIVRPGPMVVPRIVLPPPPIFIYGPHHRVAAPPTCR